MSRSKTVEACASLVQRQLLSETDAGILQQAWDYSQKLSIESSLSATDNVVCRFRLFENRVHDEFHERATVVLQEFTNAMTLTNMKFTAPSLDHETNAPLHGNESAKAKASTNVISPDKIGKLLHRLLQRRESSSIAAEYAPYFIPNESSAIIEEAAAITLSNAIQKHLINIVQHAVENMKSRLACNTFKDEALTDESSSLMVSFGPNIRQTLTETTSTNMIMPENTRKPMQMLSQQRIVPMIMTSKELHAALSELSNSTAMKKSLHRAKILTCATSQKR